MVNLTVGYVSGMIAAAVFVTQFIVPNAVILILVGVLSNEETAVTWSVVEHSLAKSSWPNLLRADSTSSKGVAKRVLLITWLRFLVVGLVTAAAVVTPLGLYDTIAPAKNPQFLSFSYIPDTGPMGYGTPPRSGMGFTRSCGDYYPIPCPGTSINISYYINQTYGTVEGNITDDNYDMRIPKTLASLYQSGLSSQPQSVSSFFDIQSRQYTYRKEKGVEHQNQYIVDTYRQLDSIVLNNAIEPLEGVIVDSINGAVGFRNHTVPMGVEYGAEWEEDILFIEPQTACVNTNLTWEWMIPWEEAEAGTESINLNLVDQGGFVNINKTYPEFHYSDNQKNPMLRERAYRAAWGAIANSMLYLNVTRPNPHAFSYLKSAVGKRFPLSSDISLAPYSTFSTTTLFETLINLDNAGINFSGVGPAPVYPNPFNISSANYTSEDILCQGAGGQDMANISNIAVACGLMLGAATPANGTRSLIFAPGTWWTQPLYSCASTSRALIKTVRFKYNATSGSGLKRLEIVDLTNKVYLNDSAMPLWGVEKPHMTLANISPLWGLISADQEHAVNLSTRRSPHLYLPGTTIGFGVSTMPGYQFVPASTGPNTAWDNAYFVASGIDSAVPDYTGYSNLAIYVKWLELSRNESTAANILNLIWTDIAANSMVGTRSWNSGDTLPPNLQKRDSSTSVPFKEATQVPVTIYTHQIRYHWVFAIPALFVLALALLILVAVMVVILRGRASKSRVRYFLSQLSAGRLLTKIAFPEEFGMQASTDTWLTKMGRQPICLDENVHHSTATEEKPAEDSMADERCPALTFQNEINSDDRGVEDIDKNLGYDYSKNLLAPTTYAM